MNTAEAESRKSTTSAKVVEGTKDWVNGTEFVPRQPNWGRTAPFCTEAPLQGSVTKEASAKKPSAVETKKLLCFYAAVGVCCFGENCVYLHGDMCFLCGRWVLHPMDVAQRSQHVRSCMEAREKDAALSLAVQRSKDRACGICMEVVYEKANPGERRFGILTSCNHTYCLKCIREWRRAKQFVSKITKACPECRITSNFVIPIFRQPDTQSLRAPALVVVLLLSLRSPVSPASPSVPPFRISDRKAPLQQHLPRRPEGHGVRPLAYLSQQGHTETGKSKKLVVVVGGQPDANR
ncbi:E3 ubiquitin-protein ligase makorin-1 [Tupaia chinensis]|uniref:RING-type E3 ubiquitin transferase n=1 Tax=Tupaia chinensis TaxID=246437 RepID=L9L6S1_TUPCH|nr:E3 ubiquitin-protein ligase makorin-1 [Tupaia chinensis]